VFPSLGLAISDAQALLAEFAANPKTLEAMERIAAAMISTIEQGNKILVAGNGGSMADAMHVAEELSGRFRLDRRPYGAIALSDPAHMSCVANDYGYEYIFSRQVEGLGRSGDLLILMTTSGNSKNLLNAAEKARAKGVTVVGALGGDGGALLPLCDLVLMAPGKGSDRIQELHMLAFHAIIEAVELAVEQGQ
jgi:D-sedoheptulose 7-phosphate isomerase